MTRFQLPAAVSPRRRVEIAAAVLIPTLVVGIPFVTNYSRGGKPTSVTAAGGRPALETSTNSTTVADPLASLFAPDGEPVELAAEGLPLAAPDSSFWDVYSAAGGGLMSLPSPVTGNPGSSSTSTTLGTASQRGLATPGGFATPTSTSSTTRPPPVAQPIAQPASPPTSAPASVPRAPTNLVTDFGSPSLLASWTPVSTNTDGTAFGNFQTYEVTVSARGVSRTYQTTRTSFTYTIGQNGTDFGTPQPHLTVTVRAVATSGARSGPVTAVAANDPPPTAASPANLTSDSAHVTVTPPSQGSIDDLAGFDIFHSESSSGPFALLASTDGYDSFEHAVSTGSTHHYVYKIRDVFGQVSPGFSPTATATAL